MTVFIWNLEKWERQKLKTSIINSLFQYHHFVVSGPKKLQTFTTNPHFFSDLWKLVLSILLLFSCACYQVDLDDIQWNEVATSTGHNLNNSWLLYLHFLNIINLSPNIWFIKNSKCQQFLFRRKSRQSNTNVSFSLNSRYFVKGDSIDLNAGVFWETFGDILKSTILKIISFRCSL